MINKKVLKPKVKRQGPRAIKKAERAAKAKAMPTPVITSVPVPPVQVPAIRLPILPKVRKVKVKPTGTGTGIETKKKRAVKRSICVGDVDYVISTDPAMLNLGVCMIGLADEKIKYWNKLNLVDSERECMENVCASLTKQLDTIDLLNHECFKNPLGGRKPRVAVISEIQPNKNKKTLIISGMLMMYFTLSARRDNLCEVVQIIGYPARYKLNYYVPLEGEEAMPNMAKYKNSYYRRKLTGVEHTKRILKRKGEEQYYEFLMNEKKKDDLADAYLQGLSWIFFEYNRSKNITTDVPDVPVVPVSLDSFLE